MTAVAVMEMVQQADHPQLALKRVSHKAPRALDAYMQDHHVRQPGASCIPIVPEERETADGLAVFKPKSSAERTLMMQTMQYVAEYLHHDMNVPFEKLPLLVSALGIREENLDTLIEIESVFEYKYRSQINEKYQRNIIAESAEFENFIKINPELKKSLKDIE